MKKMIFCYIFLFSMQWSYGQCINPDFDKEVKRNLKGTIPLISVNELQKNYTKYIILDARETKEFQVSHLKNAKNIGFEKFDLRSIKDTDKTKPIVVYCSIGVRSELIGEKLKAAGFENVFNLYGSIFEWSNQGLPLYDKNQKLTQNIHTYNKAWSRWVEKGKKVY